MRPILGFSAQSSSGQDAPKKTLHVGAALAAASPLLAAVPEIVAFDRLA